MRVVLCATLVLSLLATPACGGSELEFADWVEPLPREGVPVHEYAAVPHAERAGKLIEVVDDLVLGDALDPAQAFYQPSYVDTDAAGNIFVLDRGDPRIQVFDAEGTYLWTMGTEGQGPGELARPSYLLVTAEHVVVRADTRRLSTWTLEGEHVRDRQLTDSLLSVMASIRASWPVAVSGRRASPAPRCRAPSPATPPTTPSASPATLSSTSRSPRRPRSRCLVAES